MARMGRKCAFCSDLLQFARDRGRMASDISRGYVCYADVSNFILFAMGELNEEEGIGPRMMKYKVKRFIELAVRGAGDDAASATHFDIRHLPQLFWEFTPCDPVFDDDVVAENRDREVA